MSAEQPARYEGECLGGPRDGSMVAFYWPIIKMEGMHGPPPVQLTDVVEITRPLYQVVVLGEYRYTGGEYDPKTNIISRGVWKWYPLV